MGKGGEGNKEEGRQEKLFKSKSNDDTKIESAFCHEDDKEEDENEVKRSVTHRVRQATTLMTRREIERSRRR